MFTFFYKHNNIEYYKAYGVVKSFYHKFSDETASKFMKDGYTIINVAIYEDKEAYTNGKNPLLVKPIRNLKNPTSTIDQHIKSVEFKNVLQTWLQTFDEFKEVEFEFKEMEFEI